jgi:hypothetical protein
MRTTVRLEDNLLCQAKREARERGETLTSMIERGLRLTLATEGRKLALRRVKLPVSKASGGTLPGVDLDDSSLLLDVMESRR